MKFNFSTRVEVLPDYPHRETLDGAGNIRYDYRNIPEDAIRLLPRDVRVSNVVAIL